MMLHNKSPAGVFWDLDTSCHFPDEYDPYQVRQSIESALKDYLPLTISAIGNLKRIPHPLLEPILSTGIFMKHCIRANINIMVDMNTWRKNNPAPATIILITDREALFEDSGVLPSIRRDKHTIITKSWRHIFSAETTSKEVKDNGSETAWVCHLCIRSGLTFAGESYESLTRHFKSEHHIFKEHCSRGLKVFKKFYQEASSSLPKKTGVWWDMDTCLVPIGVEPYQVRQNIESRLIEVGMIRPFTISAIGNLNRIPPYVLKPILSTGIFMRHSKDGPVDILNDMDMWAFCHPPPATIVLISDHEQVFLTDGFLPSLSDKGYTIIRAFQNHSEFPPKYASQTILCDYLLSAGYEDTNQETTSTKVEHKSGSTSKSLKSHFKSAEHEIQEKAITMAKPQSEARLNTSIEYFLSEESEDDSSLTKTTGVWWDTNSCHAPRGYNPFQVRQSIESALKDYLPLTITAIGNLKRSPYPLLEPIFSFSSGIRVIHGKDGSVDISKDMERWALSNPPPATLILISDREEVFVGSGILPSFKERGYTIIRAFQKHPEVSPKYASQMILWDYLLSAGYEDTNQETTSTKVEYKCSETAWVCNICIESGRTFKSLKTHFKSAEHKIQECSRLPLKVKNKCFQDTSSGVWWDMDTCLVPKGFDPFQVRQCIESALKNHLPFTITAIGNICIPFRRLYPIFSSGIRMLHGKDGPVDILKDMERWALSHPPPATLILISDREEVFVVSGILPSFKERGYTIIRAFQKHTEVPPKYASQMILWDYLLSAGYEDSNQETTSTKVEYKCSETAWVCNICIESGRTFKSLKTHFKSAEHKIQECSRLRLKVKNKCFQEASSGVWWDMDTCLVPKGFDPFPVRQCIESALKNHLPFTISAIGNVRSPYRDWYPIFSSGIRVIHGKDGPVDILKDMERWALSHPPPATLILISDREEVFVGSGILPSFKERGYTIIRAFQKHPEVPPKYASQMILWDYLLSAGCEDSNQETTSTKVEYKCSETAWVCNMCIKSGRTFAGESYKSLKRHFKSAEHKIQNEKKVSTNVKNQSMASGNT